MKDVEMVADWDQQQRKLYAALSAFQKTIPTIQKGATANAGKFKYSYATLEAVTEVVLPKLAEHGLAWTCYTTMMDGRFTLVYQLLHEDGGVLSGEYPLPPPNTAPQQLGSAMTYAKRYALLAVTGVAPGGEDDDGVAAQAASQRAPQGYLGAPTGSHGVQVELITPAGMSALQKAASTLGLSGENVLAEARHLGFRGPNLGLLPQATADRLLAVLQNRAAENVAQPGGEEAN